jgi:hypothetical protein
MMTGFSPEKKDKIHESEFCGLEVENQEEKRCRLRQQS